MLGLAGPIDVQWARSILNACSLEFFDWRLKRCPAVLLAGQVEQRAWKRADLNPLYLKR